MFDPFSLGCSQDTLYLLMFHITSNQLLNTRLLSVTVKKLFGIHVILLPTNRLKVRCRHKKLTGAEVLSWCYLCICMWSLVIYQQIDKRPDEE